MQPHDPPARRTGARSVDLRRPAGIRPASPAAVRSDLAATYGQAPYGPAAATVGQQPAPYGQTSPAPYGQAPYGPRRSTGSSSTRRTRRPHRPTCSRPTRPAYPNSRGKARHRLRVVWLVVGC